MKRRPFVGNRNENRMAANLDKLAKFEEFEREILPALKADLANGATPAQLREKFAAYLEARKLTIALTDPDASKALAAIKDIQDRSEGKAKERTEHTHRLENLPETQFESLLLTELENLKKKQDQPN